MRNWMILGILLLCSSMTLALLDCNVRKGLTCPGSEVKVLGMSNYTNAHAELYNENNEDHNWSVCCVDDTYTVTTNCGTVFLRLNETTNSHVEKEFMNSPDYPYEACMDASEAEANITCLYTSAACPENYTCVVTLNETLDGYPNTSMHVASCNDTPYAEKVCCALQADEGVIPDLTRGGVIIVGVMVVIASFVIMNKRK